MTSFLKNSTLYKIQDIQIEPVLHKETIEAELLLMLSMDLGVPPEIVEMLNKICSALKLENAKVEYLTFKEATALIEVQSKYKAKNIVVFGAEPKDLNLNAHIERYKVYAFQHFNLLWVNDVLDIYSTQQLKAKLWHSLQEMFK